MQFLAHNTEAHHRRLKLGARDSSMAFYRLEWDLELRMSPTAFPGTLAQSWIRSRVAALDFPVWKPASQAVA